jgi:hypothetical protein
MARLAVELGHLPEPGGTEDQDPLALWALEVLKAEWPRGA